MPSKNLKRSEEILQIDIAISFLSKFLPAYFDAVLGGELKKYVMYIIIQGHTDSQLEEPIMNVNQLISIT